MPDRASPAPEQLLAEAEEALAGGGVLALDGLSLDAPRLDPDEPRRSAAELMLLACALGRGQRVPARPELGEPPRVGYQIAIQGGTPVAWPAFAEALARGDRAALSAAAAEIWRIDASLHGQLATASIHDLALAWLGSPGRRLIQELGLLRAMADGLTRDGATDLRWERLRAAAEGPGPAPSAEYASIHGAWPGASLGGWVPIDVVHALYTLEQGWPAHARGGALCWLLHRVTAEPVVSLAGVRRHLGDELPGRLAVAFSKEAPAARLAARAADVEALCLTHAALIARAHGREDEVEATWHLARWIQTTTLASPFYGGDPESLVARLRALLPSQLGRPTSPLPPLTPARFGAGAREHPELDLTEHAWASAAAEHYADPDSGLRPVPQPLIDGLRAIAARPLSGAEHALERDLDAETPHVAPPMIARRVLSEGIRASWLGALAHVAGVQIVELLRQGPGRLRWLATAALDDGGSASVELGLALLSCWRDSSVLGAWDPEERCALAIGLSPRWQTGDAERLLGDLLALPSDTSDLKMALMRQLLRRLDAPQASLRARALRVLVSDAERVTLPDAARVEALGVAAPWLSDLDGADREDLLERARRLIEQRPFRDSVPLRRELRRLGLGAA